MAALGACVTAVGPTGSGKSELLWRRYTQDAPRKITLEVVEETMSRDSSARRVYGYDELTDSLREIVARRLPRWHVVASLDDEETERLFWLLCPELRSAQTKSFSAAAGGLVVSCGELVTLAQLGLSKKSPVKAAYVRGRHFGLSVHGATQHAADCDPCTRMQADRVLFMPAKDDLALSAVARASSSRIADVVASLPDFHSVTCIRREGRAYVADSKDKLVKVLDYRGTVLWPSANESPRSSGVPQSNGSRRVVGASRGGFSG